MPMMLYVWSNLETASQLCFPGVKRPSRYRAWSQFFHNRAPVGSVGRVCAPCTKAQSLLRWPRIRFQPRFALLIPVFLSHFSYLCQMKLEKPKKFFRNTFLLMLCKTDVALKMQHHKDCTLSRVMQLYLTLWHQTKNPVWLSARRSVIRWSLRSQHG